jgi:LmbE family N-acetylglucosaminyl deacetylase
VHVLVVSPHYDDAPLSLGQSMVDGELARHRVRVGIVFGRSNWVRWWHPSRRRAPLVGAVRRVEEAHAGLRFGYRWQTAPLEEAVLRLGTSDAAAYLEPGFDPTGTAELEAVTEVVRDWATGADVVLAPLGLGDHVDHRLCAAAARTLAGEGVRVAYYEDRPYASYCTPGEIEARARQFGPPTGAELERRAVSGPIGPEKLRRLRYPSQIDDYFDAATATDVTSSACEATWTPVGDPWPAC